jgi:hypothetical protein
MTSEIFYISDTGGAFERLPSVCGDGKCSWVVDMNSKLEAPRQIFKVNPGLTGFWQR